LKRECELVAMSEDGRRAIYIDSQNKDEILEYIRQSDRDLKKWRHIIQLLLEGHKNTELYDKEDIDSRCKDVTAMKFFKGQENDRIYCKELNTPGLFIIVQVELYLRKKGNKVSKKEKPIIKNIATYEYEIK
jgi:hypothetical protein